MLLPAITLSLCGQRRQIDRLNCGEGKTFFYGKRGFSPHLPHLSYPYSRKRALHFCRRQKASHCEAMLHDGCNPSLHISCRSVVAAVCIAPASRACRALAGRQAPSQRARRNIAQPDGFCQGGGEGVDLRPQPNRRPPTRRVPAKRDCAAIY